MKFSLLVMGVMSFFLSFFFLKKSFLFKWSWLTLKKTISFELKFFLDWISLIFFGVLLMMVFSVKEFSKFYMSSDPFFLRFFWILMLFVLSMCILIFFPKLVFVLVGWDGLGMTSFLLMMYYKSFSSWASGLKTYLMKRLGDGLIMLALVKLFYQGHWNMISFDYTLNMFLLAVLVTSLFTKSAQYPFSSWLPAAMAAPTPVSALVHSSTLVTAGMYLLIRFHYCFSWPIKMFMGMIGLFTLFKASFAACVEWDFKKVMAFSTLSQLGLMCFAMSCGLSLLGFFHLLTHAVFKALLFMSAGLILGKQNHFQDLRQLGGMKKFSPLMDFALITSILALSGFPFLSGFFSKDLILEKNLKIFKMVFIALFWVSLILTVFYSFRLIFFLYYKKKIKSKNVYFQINSSKIWSVSLLIGCSIFLGSLVKIYWLNTNIVSYKKKLLLMFLLMLGWGMIKFKGPMLKNKFWWLFSKCFFLESFKTFFFFKNFSFLGSMMFEYDQGVSLNKNLFVSKKINKLKNALVSSGNFFVKKIFLVSMIFFLFVSGTILLVL